MAKKTVATEEVVEKVVEMEESEAKKAFRHLIAEYAKANPVKYELKKADLEKQLNNIK